MSSSSLADIKHSDIRRATMAKLVWPITKGLLIAAAMGAGFGALAAAFAMWPVYILIAMSGGYGFNGPQGPTLPAIYFGTAEFLGAALFLLFLRVGEVFGDAAVVIEQAVAEDAGRNRQKQWDAAAPARELARREQEDLQARIEEKRRKREFEAERKNLVEEREREAARYRAKNAAELENITKMRDIAHVHLAKAYAEFALTLDLNGVLDSDEIASSFAAEKLSDLMARNPGLDFGLVSSSEKLSPALKLLVPYLPRARTALPLFPQAALPLSTAQQDAIILKRRRTAAVKQDILDGYVRAANDRTAREEFIRDTLGSAVSRSTILQPPDIDDYQAFVANELPAYRARFGDELNFISRWGVSFGEPAEPLRRALGPIPPLVFDVGCVRASERDKIEMSLAYPKGPDTPKISFRWKDDPGGSFIPVLDP